MTVQKLNKANWHGFFDFISKLLEGIRGSPSRARLPVACAKNRIRNAGGSSPGVKQKCSKKLCWVDGDRRQVTRAKIFADRRIAAPANGAMRPDRGQHLR